MAKKTNIIDNKEIRRAEISAQSDGRHVSGYAVRFESESVNMGFVEIIHRGAITEETIKKSDVFALLNHSTDVVLARSRNGKGSLTLSVDENGVFYEFDAPKTSAGDELLEHIKRGEISQSSFAFSVANEEGAEKWTKRANGTIVREIFNIERLYDISPVYQPAYELTTCSQRALDKVNELTNTDNMNDENLTQEQTAEQSAEQQEIEMLKARIEALENELKKTTEESEQTPSESDEEKEPESEETDAQTDEENSTEINNNESEEVTEESTEETTEDENKDKINTRNISTMEKFVLTKEIRKAMADGSNKIDMRAYTVSDEGTDVVGTDVFDIFAPLRAKNVITDAGVRILTGIKNNIQVPVFGATIAKFAGETVNASDGTGSITSVKLSPKRVTAKVPVSLELIAQDSVGVEQMIREDLANAVYAVVEDKIFGRQAETADVYAGMCKWPVNASLIDGSTFAGIANAESAVEGLGVDVNKCKWVVSPSAKAKLRAMPKSSKTTQLTLEGGEIDGTPVLSTGHLNDSSIGGIYGDFSNAILGTWDNVQLDVVRDTASLESGVVNIVVNAFVDFKVARPEAFSYVKI